MGACRTAIAIAGRAATGLAPAGALVVGALVVGALAVGAPDARAGGDPNAAKSIVARFCVKCHQVPGYKARHGRASVPAPPFQAMADDPERYPPSRIYGALRKPHYYMRGMTMSEQNIQDLIAFIESLRKKSK
jgi:cytochrome c553